MKILKWILIVIIALIGVFLIYSASQPNKIELEESIVIDAPAEMVYAEVIDFPSWGNWSVWHGIDPEMKNEYMGDPGKVGYANEWKSNHQQVGNGKMEIVELTENALMKTKMTFDGWDGVSYAMFTFSEEDGKTTVSWSMDGAETPFYFNFMNSLMLPIIRENYKKGLSSLKEVVESKPMEVANPMNLEVMEVEGRNIISILDSTDGEGISEKLKELYTELTIFMTAKELESAGMPLAFYHVYSPERVVLEAALPYNGEAEGEGRIVAKQTPSGKVVKGIHYGSYDASEPMHIAIDEYVKANKMEFNVCWEVYENDPGEVDSADVETHIYYSVN